MEAEEGGWAGGLRDQEPGRVEQVAVVDGEFAADTGRPEAQAEADSVGPDGPLIKSVDIIEVDRRPFEDILGRSKDVAAVVERYGPDSLGERYAGLDVDHRKPVTAKGNGKGIKEHLFTAAVIKGTFRNYHNTRAGAAT